MEHCGRVLSKEIILLGLSFNRITFIAMLKIGHGCNVQAQKDGTDEGLARAGSGRDTEVSLMLF